jgi:hypothetical protein
MSDLWAVDEQSRMGTVSARFHQLYAEEEAVAKQKREQGLIPPGQVRKKGKGGGDARAGPPGGGSGPGSLDRV